MELFLDGNLIADTTRSSVAKVGSELAKSPLGMKYIGRNIGNQPVTTLIRRPTKDSYDSVNFLSVNNRSNNLLSGDKIYKYMAPGKNGEYYYFEIYGQSGNINPRTISIDPGNFNLVQFINMYQLILIGRVVIELSNIVVGRAPFKARQILDRMSSTVNTQTSNNEYGHVQRQVLANQDVNPNRDVNYESRSSRQHLDVKRGTSRPLQVTQRLPQQQPLQVAQRLPQRTSLTGGRMLRNVTSGQYDVRR